MKKIENYERKMIEKTPTYIKYETESDKKPNEQNLNLQEENLRKKWKRFTKEISKKDFDSTQLQEKIFWFMEKFQKSRSQDGGVRSGGWTHMIYDMSKDRELGQTLKNFREMEFTKFVTKNEMNTEREKFLAQKIKSDAREENEDKKDEIRENMKFMENLLDSTSNFFAGPKDERDEKKGKILISMWADIFARFKEMRVSALKERLESLLPKIEKIKNEVEGFLKKNYGEFISKEGLERIKKVPIWIADEYLESGTDWQVAASYSGTNGQIEISGQDSLNFDSMKPILKHELTHAASGHGSLEEIEFKNDKFKNVSNQRRIGLSTSRKKNVWINEALTEQLTLEQTGQTDSGFYMMERRFYNLTKIAYGVSQKEILRWYFSEGDDSSEKERLEASHPEFFKTLKFIQDIIDKKITSKAMGNFNSEDADAIILRMKNEGVIE